MNFPDLAMKVNDVSRGNRMQLGNYLTGSVMGELYREDFFAAEKLMEETLSVGERVSYHNIYHVDPTRIGDRLSEKSFKGYEGPAALAFDCFVVDIDNKEIKDINERIEKSKREAIEITNWFKNQGVNTVCYFSGNKGFHLYVHGSAINAIGKFDGNEIKSKVRNALAVLVSKFPSIDKGIYDLPRKMRVFGSKHQESEYFKIKVDLDMDVSDILATAKEKPDRSDFELPLPGPVIGELVSEYQEPKRVFNKTDTGEVSSFERFEDKKCIKSMLKNPRRDDGIGLHDLSMRIVPHLHFTLDKETARKKLNEWCERAFSEETDKKKRIDETMRALRDAESGKVYSYGCFDDVKKSYCSGKCALFKNLDLIKRATPPDISEAQKKKTLVAKKKAQVVFGEVERMTGFVDVSEAGEPLQTIDNVRFIFNQLDAKYRYNEISKKISIDVPGGTKTKGYEVDDSLAIIRSEAIRLGIKGVNQVNSFAYKVCRDNPFNPVSDWINSKPWDGVDRLDDLYSTVVAFDEDNSNVLKMKKTMIRKWMISAVALGTSKEGKKCEGVLIFRGDQGFGKSQWFNSLVPKHLGLTKDSMSVDPSKRDPVMKVISHWLVELAELGQSMKSDRDAMKAFLTADVDTWRLPYGVGDVDFPRRTVFFGSVNDAKFLVDETGSRRFWVINCKSVNWEHAIDMQQCWAQVNQLYLDGERWFLDRSEISTLGEMNKEHQKIDPVIEKLETFLDDKLGIPQIFNATEIYEHLYGATRPASKSDLNAIASYLMAKGVKRNDRKKFHVCLISRRERW